MRNPAIYAIALVLGIHSASAVATDQRPQLKDVSSVRVANYGTPSTVITDREQVNAIVGELRQLRNKNWRRADSKISCYATLVLLSGSRPLALFRVRPDLVVERPQEKRQSSYSLAIGEADLPGVISLLTRIPPATDCQ